MLETVKQMVADQLDRGQPSINSRVADYMLEMQGVALSTELKRLDKFASRCDVLALDEYITKTLGDLHEHDGEKDAEQL